MCSACRWLTVPKHVADGKLSIKFCLGLCLYSSINSIFKRNGDALLNSHTYQLITRRNAAAESTNDCHSSLPTTPHSVYRFRGIWRAVSTLRGKLNVTRVFALVCIVLLLWGNAFIIAGKEAGPDGQLFRIGVLGIAAYLAGVLVQSIGLPPLLGMLITGIVLRNTRSVEIKGPYLVFTADIRFVHCNLCHRSGGAH